MTESLDYPEILDRLDEYFEAAYFSPLSINDALAVQFQNPALKGLPLGTIRDVFRLVDRLKDQMADNQANDDAEIDPASLFFKHLKQDLPEIYDLWFQGDPDMHLDPGGAILNAETMGQDAVTGFLRNHHSDIDPELLKKTVESAVGEIVRGLRISEHITDRDLGQSLRSEILEKYPPWARPSIYLDIWSRFVRTVADLDPDPDLRAVWPY